MAIFMPYSSRTKTDRAQHPNTSTYLRLRVFIYLVQLRHWDFEDEVPVVVVQEDDGSGCDAQCHTCGQRLELWHQVSIT